MYKKQWSNTTLTARIRSDARRWGHGYTGRPDISIGWIRSCLVGISKEHTVVLSHFSLTLSFISSIAIGKDIILLGDFNQPDINWENLASSNCSSKLFCNFVFDSNFLQLVKSPTHVKGNILDLILTNSENLVQKLSVHSNEPFPSMKSDHIMLSFTTPFQLSKTNPARPPTFNFSKGNYELMNEFIESTDLSSFYNSTDIEYLWSSLKSLLQEHYCQFIPKSIPSAVRYPKWFTGDIIHKLNQVRFLRRKVKAIPTVHNIFRLKSAEKLLTNDITTAKCQYASQLVHAFAFNNSAPIYNYIRSITKQSILPSVMFLDSRQESSSSGKAEIFNKFFHSVFIDSLPVVSPPDLSDSETRCEIVSFSEDVYQVLS